MEKGERKEEGKEGRLYREVNVRYGIPPTGFL